MKNLLLSLVLCMSVSFGLAQTKTITASPAGTGTVTWSKDTTYVLDGFVFVNSGQTLTIEAGTVIQGKPGQGSDASALIVARGAKILAEGTEQEPIIFTAEGDDVTNPFDIAPHTVGQWGGVIILGNSTTNTDPPEQAIEGIPTTETRGLFGAIDPNNDGDYSDATTNENDSSGVFRYVSIRHGGTNIGANNEINGLTMGAVGSATIIDHVEVIFNQDDGFEWFGGTVNCSHLIAAFCGDDSYDYDMGWRGYGQFWFTIQSEEAGSDRGGEHDGGTTPETGDPLARPFIYNVTSIGRPGGDKRGLTFRDNAGGEYHNSIFADHDRGVDFEILGNGSTDSYDRLQAGDLELRNNIWWNVAGNDSADIFTVTLGKYGVNTADSLADLAAGTAWVQAYFDSTGQTVVNPEFVQLDSLSRTAGENALDPRPQSGYAIFPASPSSEEPNDPFFVDVDYKGAFSVNASEFWADEWTYMDELGYFPQPLSQATGIFENPEIFQGVKLFPNPNQGRFTIAGENLSVDAVEIKVYDITGRVIHAESVQPIAGELEYVMDLGNVPTGMYIIKTQQGSKIASGQIIKQ